MNNLLRNELDKATEANQTLIADLNRLLHIKEEYEAKEEEWRKDEQVGSGELATSG